MVMTLPARLLIRTGWPSLTRVHHLPDQGLRRCPVVTERRRCGLESFDVAVVVGAEHVDAQVEAAVAFVAVVGDVSGDVGGLTVTLDDDARSLSSPKSAVAQPPGTILRTGLPLALRLFDAGVDESALEHEILVGNTRRSR